MTKPSLLSAGVADLLQRIPGPVSEAWPAGERFARAFAHGTMSVELYAPRGSDPQQPHRQDELYFVIAGTGDFVLEGKRIAVSAGAALFVPAGVPHRFESFSPDFVTWVVFWGPEGGEEDPASALRG